MRSLTISASVLVFLAVQPHAARAQTAEDDTIQASGQVLREIMAIPGRGIPQSLLREAQGVAIVPGMIRGGFILGVQHGRGVVLVRDKAGAWQSPNFITITGGGIGWQAGLQSTDVILVFRTRTSVDNLMRGKFTVGADASVAAGPVGRQASAATDATLRSEIFSYSRSRGLFAGVSVDGAVIQIDNRANAAFYGLRPGQTQTQFPPAALNLIMQVAALTNTPARQPTDRDAVRQQLAEASERLQSILDPQWQQFLALPADFFEGAQPTTDRVAPVRARFQTVSTDPRYRALADRHEFQETYALLSRFAALSAAQPNTGLKLPPPPQ